MKIQSYFSDKRKRRQRLVYSLLEELKIGIPQEMAPPDPPALSPINVELAPGSTVGAPATAPGLDYATEASFPPLRGVVAAALAKKEISFPPPEIVRLSAESYNYGAILLGNSQDWVLVVHNDGGRESTILALEGLPAQGFSLPDPPVLPQTIPPQGSQALSIRFAPDSGGEKAAALTMTAWTQDEQILEVPLRGTGITTIQTPAGVYRSQVANSLGMAFVYIAPGAFSMGSPEHEPGRNEDETQHDVRLTQAFYLQTTPVTQGQWQALMGSHPAFFINCGDDCPVEQVSWLDCQKFLKKLNALGEGTYRLPTEAEWEYACRAGSAAAFALGEITSLFCDPEPILQELGWYCGNAERSPHPVAEKEPNAWGLHDMHGNVCEWCLDWYGEYLTATAKDSKGPKSGTKRVIRGGSWYSSAKTCRSASRLQWSPDSMSPLVGFRLVREL
jgi:formylglycine-generating enzyme required for sulfatase activity